MSPEPTQSQAPSNPKGLHGTALLVTFGLHKVMFFATSACNRSCRSHCSGAKLGMLCSFAILFSRLFVVLPMAATGASTLTNINRTVWGCSVARASETVWLSGGLAFRHSRNARACCQGPCSQLLPLWPKLARGSARRYNSRSATIIITAAHGQDFCCYG